MTLFFNAGGQQNSWLSQEEIVGAKVSADAASAKFSAISWVSPKIWSISMSISKKHFADGQPDLVFPAPTFCFISIFMSNFIHPFLPPCLSSYKPWLVFWDLLFWKKGITHIQLPPLCPCTIIFYWLSLTLHLHQCSHIILMQILPSTQFLRPQLWTQMLHHLCQDTTIQLSQARKILYFQSQLPTLWTTPMQRTPSLERKMMTIRIIPTAKMTTKTQTKPFQLNAVSKTAQNISLNIFHWCSSMVHGAHSDQLLEVHQLFPLDGYVFEPNCATNDLSVKPNQPVSHGGWWKGQ